MPHSVKISVVIPSFNLEGELDRCLSSVLAQTSPADEILVIDDGSTDQSARVAERFPVRLVRQANLGAGAARNRGIREANGSWVAFLDGDDEWLPDRIAHLRRAIADDPDSVLIANDEFEGPKGGPWVHKPLHERFDPGRNAFLQLYRSCFLSTSAVAVRREVLLEVGGMNERLPSAQDYDLWLRVCRKGPIRFIPLPLSRYVIRDGSISSRVQGRLDCLLFIADSHAGAVPRSLHLYRVALSYYETCKLFLKSREVVPAALTAASLPWALVRRLFGTVKPPVRMDR